MRVMVMVKASAESESGQLPGRELLSEMSGFNGELLKSGVLLSAEGLQASSRGVRVRFGGGHSTVTDGPFTASQELIAGFWLWQVKSLDEALEWLRRSPFKHGTAEVEIRPILEAEDFAHALAAAAARSSA